MAVTQRRRNGFGLSSIGERTRAGLTSSAITAIDRENVTITAVSVPNTVAPGETVQLQARVDNSATSIPSDDPFFCRDRNGVAGVSVTVGGGLTLEGVGDPTPQLDETAFCSTPGESRLVTVTFTAPQTTGDYIGTMNAGWHDPPQVWDATELFRITVEGPGGEPPGDGDEIFGVPRDQAFIALGVAGLGLGGAALLL